MNVLHITYDMRIGGTEMVIKNIIEGNRDNDIHMSIFCIEAPLGPWGEELKAKGVPVFTHERKPGFDVSLIRAIRQHIKTHNIDVVHCHQYTPWVYGTLASVLTKAKVIFTEHGRFYPDSSSWKRKLVNPILAAMTHAITSISKATRDALVTYEFLPHSRIDVIYNGIQPVQYDQEEVEALRETLGLDHDVKILGTIARFDPIKNQTMMLNAFAQVLKSYPSTLLLMVGDGEMRSDLETQATQLGIEKHILFTGYIAKPAQYLALMDIFLLSSLSEGTSMTLLEAMSLGKPCVVTNAGGNGEVIAHNQNGLVTPNNDTNAFANAMIELLGNHKQREKFIVNAKQRFANQFNVATMSNAFHALYNNLKPSVQ